MSRNLKQLSIILFLAAVMCGCTKKDFKIEFSLPEDVFSNYTLTYYASGRNSGFTVENVAFVSAGKGSVTCPSVRPTVVFISTPGGLDLPVYAERGETIRISGPDNNPWSWTIRGNDLDEAFSEWVSINEPSLIGGSRQAINDSIAAYVSRNPDSSLSPFLLLTLFSRRDNETSFRRLWNSVANTREAIRLAEIIGRSDIPDGVARTPGKLQSAVFRSLYNGVDTIRPADAKATLLYFWSLDKKEKRTIAIDSLRNLSTEFPDSSARIIADIGLEPDSISWKSPLVKDSISGVLRLWIPAGLADSRVMDLNVPRVPFFIVFSPDGNQKYRGDDAAEAISSFRDLMK